MVNTDITHGINQHNIDLLVNHTNSGLLLVSDDCGRIDQEEWFRSYFDCLRDSTIVRTTLWSAK